MASATMSNIELAAVANKDAEDDVEDDADTAASGDDSVVADGACWSSGMLGMADGGRFEREIACHSCNASRG